MVRDRAASWRRHAGRRPDRSRPRSSRQADRPEDAWPGRPCHLNGRDVGSSGRRHHENFGCHQPGDPGPSHRHWLSRCRSHRARRRVSGSRADHRRLCLVRGLPRHCLRCRALARCDGGTSHRFPASARRPPPRAPAASRTWRQGRAGAESAGTHAAASVPANRPTPGRTSRADRPRPCSSPTPTPSPVPSRNSLPRSCAKACGAKNPPTGIH